MSGRPDIDELFEVWRSAPLPAVNRKADESRGILAVAAALGKATRHTRRKQAWRRARVAFGVAAGVFAVVIAGWVLDPDPTRHAASASSVVRLDDFVGEVTVKGSSAGAPTAGLAEGDGLSTERGEARLGFPSGAAVNVTSRTTLKITAAGRHEALYLAKGSVDVIVPALDAGRGFAVVTPDSLVVVHGTRFTVSVEAAPDGVYTKVKVARGVVAVRHGGKEVILTAGQEWPPLAEARRVTDGDIAPNAFNAPAAAEGAPSMRREKHGSSRKLLSRGLGNATSPELAAQNRQFSDAMALKKHGDAEGAIAAFTALLRSHPRIPLAQEARVERMRVLRSSGRHRDAAREARSYLTEFENGFAREEAREITMEQH
jgi:ferric-dicitrate binding protein FerR (iron transport regulator)